MEAIKDKLREDKAYMGVRLYSGAGYHCDRIIIEVDEFMSEDYEVILGRAVKAGRGYSIDNNHISHRIDFDRLENDERWIWIDNSRDDSEAYGGFVGFIVIENSSVNRLSLDRVINAIDEGVVILFDDNSLENA
jgi:hypothetical protein